MKFTYEHEELYDYNFLTIGAELDEETRTIELNDAQYKRFRAETGGTTHRLVLTKETKWNR